MAEFINSNIVKVASGQNLPFSETAVKGGCGIVHREGAGIITLRGATNQCRARYKASFGGNIAIPDGEAVEEISIALSVSGEPLSSTIATVTPAAVDNYFNIFTAVYIDVPRGCCVNVAVENVSTEAINVKNANLIIERVA